MTDRTGRLLLVLLLGAYGVACLRAPGDFGLLDGVDLAVHETGHLVFAPLGETIGVLGGTLFQLLVPATFVGYFLARRQRFAAAVCLWWVAQSCWNVSVYVADARAMELPLVGGGEHDWNYLLSIWGLLPRDTVIAARVHLAGVLLFLCSLGGALVSLDGPAPEPDLDGVTA